MQNEREGKGPEGDARRLSLSASRFIGKPCFFAEAILVVLISWGVESRGLIGTGLSALRRILHRAMQEYHLHLVMPRA